jgi:mono/diheme cytochrome c family protein
MVLTRQSHNILLVFVLSVIAFVVLGLTGCDNASQVTQNNTVKTSQAAPLTPVEPRWYSQAQVSRGYDVFQSNCAVCHKPDASGTEDWKKLDENDKLPPPPLNGTAHTWHHPLPILRRVVKKGGISLGGSMPGFEGKLSATQIDDVIAWVQSNWSDEIYSHWTKRNQQQ